MVQGFGVLSLNGFRFWGFDGFRVQVLGCRGLARLEGLDRLVGLAGLGFSVIGV